MKIQCDACEKAAAVVICCADEAALCEKCDVQIHAANKLASKHQRLPLHTLSNKLPFCDICQDKAAFIFCVEDRALFCRDCDEAIHVAGSLSGNHQRYLATGIRVGLRSICSKGSDKIQSEPPNQNFALSGHKISLPQEQVSPFMPSAWAVDEFLQLSDYESNDKLNKGSEAGFGELDWFTDIGLFQEELGPKTTMQAAEVPEMPSPQTSNAAYFRNSNNKYSNGMMSYNNKSMQYNKRPRVEVSDEEEYFTVPDLG